MAKATADASRRPADAKPTPASAAEATSPVQARKDEAARSPMRYCALPPRPEPVLPPEVSAHPGRARAIINNRNKWLNKTVLRYSFFDSGPFTVPPSQAAVVRQGFEAWREQSIGIAFQELENLREAELRIGYLEGDGSWSFVGRGALGAAANERTMSFGWRLDEDDYGLSTAIHEIGHALGMEHEHQNPRSGIVWDEDAVYKYFSGPPNGWDRSTIENNVLRHLSPYGYPGSDWDPDSVMEYQFEPGLIKAPAKYSVGLFPPGTISPADAKWIKRWYPGGFIQFENQAGGDRPGSEPLLPLNESRAVELADGQQVDFRIQVDSTRKYTIRSFGAKDTMLGLFEDVDGAPRFLVGDDDSGDDRTAEITYRLRPGRTYHVRLRLVHGGLGGTVVVMYW